jgi:hypothetical protein
MRYVTGVPRAHGCSKLGGGGSFSGPDTVNAREREMGYSPCFPHSISFGFFIFTDIVVVVVGVLVVIEGRRVCSLSHGTSS